MRPTRRTLALALVGAATALAAPTALAVPTVEGTFDLPGQGKKLTLGPDGNMWVTHEPTGTGEEVSRVTPDGTVTPFDVTSQTIGGIVTGPDGNLWITRATGITMFSTASPTDETEFTAGNNITQAQGITVGPDGNLYALSGADVVKVPPGAANTGTLFNDVLTGAATTVNGIAAGTDGMIWVADFQGIKVVSLTTDGAPTNHPLGDGGPQDVAAGPGGQVAYSNPNSSPQSIGRLTQGASPLVTPLGAVDPFGIVFANDGAYWIAQFNGKNLGHLMPDGSYTTFFDFSGGEHFPRNIAKGAGNDLWVILEKPGDSGKITRISGVEPPAAATPTPIAGKDTARPSIFAIGMPRAFSTSRKQTPISQPSAVGARIRFSLSETSAVRLTFQRALPGRRRGRRCVAPRRARPRARRCTRYKRAGPSLRRAGVAGRNVVPFSGRIGRRRPLRVGRYRLLLDATDAAGNKSLTRTKRFRIVPRRKRR